MYNAYGDWEVSSDPSSWLFAGRWDQLVSSKCAKQHCQKRPEPEGQTDQKTEKSKNGDVFGDEKTLKAPSNKVIFTRGPFPVEFFLIIKFVRPKLHRRRPKIVRRRREKKRRKKIAYLIIIIIIILRRRRRRRRNLNRNKRPKKNVQIPTRRSTKCRRNY